MYLKREDDFKWNKNKDINLYDNFPNDYDLHVFACIMDDNSLVQFIGMWDETDNGETYLHLDCVSEYTEFEYDVNDIKLWIEIPRYE